MSPRTSSDEERQMAMTSGEFYRLSEAGLRKQRYLWRMLIESQPERSAWNLKARQVSNKPTQHLQSWRSDIRQRVDFQIQMHETRRTRDRAFGTTQGIVHGALA